jgi:hypothetical protein
MEETWVRWGQKMCTDSGYENKQEMAAQPGSWAEAVIMVTRLHWTSPSCGG